mmetsp:Transcript_56154/g.162687  ORF Transcript_56154/g.162687 Transcript_56154/m.162687 type:complete len:89 (+) Transcript_56154:88-354(+)|eukprot:CAMPEP_0176118312 /NCGR_PEP_ID=MMETSP0120_2-20121206/59455_1 /TAXON_ID=160619 /ORGANISM="Kryptoperidinium foliaceum, Strain CCMP 1326" /LENGTH=88 /DNA_ID=CAMNT_0017452643 /DNA_START=82 /DNA_END=348 /DNA_ORIENTATION=-
MVWTQEEIDAFKARRSQGEGDLGKVNDFVSADQAAQVSPSRSPTARKWKPTPTDENRRSDEWLGSPTKGRRSWKVKEVVKPNVPNLDD